MIDRSEVTATLYARQKAMLSADRNKDFVAAMHYASILQNHYHTLAIEYQRLAAEAVKQIPQESTQD